MDIVVLKQAKREIKDAPKDVQADIFALFDELMAGHKLSMPVSRPLFSIHKGLYELRLSGRAGEYRVFYIIKIGDAIYVLYAAQKKKQELDRKTQEILKIRIRSIET